MNLVDTLKTLALKKPKTRVASSVNSTGAAQSTKAEVNPFLNARRNWNYHVGSIVGMNHALIAFSLISLFIAAGAVGGLIHIGSLSKFVPYVVEVDKLGETARGQVADRASPADSRVIHAAVAAFVSKARLVTPDAKLQRDAVFTVYSMLSPDDAATRKMNEYLNGDANASPFKRAQTEMVSTEIQSVIQQSPESWQVDWIETKRDRQGVTTTPPYPMRALVTVYQTAATPDTTEQQMADNPLGIHVRDYSWAKQN